MEDVDHIIFHSLARIGVKFPDSVTTLADFPKECALPALQTCLNYILGTENQNIPENISEKVALAESISSEFKTLGYSDNLEYQQIMYPNEVILRKMFMFLMGKISKQSEKKFASTPRDNLTFIMQNICRQIVIDLNTPWSPLIYKKNASIKSKPKVPERIQHSQSQDTTTEDILLSIDTPKESFNVDDIIQRMRMSRPESLVIRQPDYVKTISTAKINKQEVRNIQQNIHALKKKKDELLSILQAKKDELFKINEKKDTSMLASNLIADSENNMPKLLSIAEKERQKIAAVQSEIDAKQKVMSESNKDVKSAEERLASAKQSLRNTQGRFEALRDELELKQKVLEHLKIELENRKNQKTRVKDRHSYTKKIMEILSHIGKQKVEVDKILSDTRSVRKEMNNVYGKFERSFMVVDEIIFQDAKKDEFARKLYKTVAEVHTMCDRISKKIEESGSCSRDVRSLINAVEKEKKKNIAENIERANRDLSNDFTDPLRI